MRTVNFDVTTDRIPIRYSTQMRVCKRSHSCLPVVQNYGVTVAKSTSEPVHGHFLHTRRPASSNSKFLANYSYINLNDPILRVPASEACLSSERVNTRFGSGLIPNKLAALDITIRKSKGHQAPRIR